MISLDAESLEQVTDLLKQYGTRAADVITEALHKDAEIIKTEINPLIPVSGRTFKGHTSAARGSKWWRYDTNEKMSVTVAATSARRYLYFPDDGANTKRHAGNQQFFERGGNAALPQITEDLEAALVEAFEK